VQARIYFYAISFQSVNGKAYRQYGCYRIILFETGATLRFKAATVITSEVFLWLTKKNY
jgi:hypothetical protein